MEALVCKRCGANDLIQKNGYVICSYCNTRYVITKEDRQSWFGGNEHLSALSRGGVESTIALEDDVARLLKKCESNPAKARKYANLILDIDPDNEEALKFLKK